MHLVGAHRSVGALDQLLHLLQKRVDEARSPDAGVGVAASVTLGDEAGDGLGAAAGQMGGGPVAAGSGQRTRDVHDLLADFINVPFGGFLDGVKTLEPTAGRGSWADANGNPAVRPPGFLVSVSRDSCVRLPGV